MPDYSALGSAGAAPAQAPRGGYWAAWVKEYLSHAVCGCQNVQTSKVFPRRPFLKDFHPKKTHWCPETAAERGDDKRRPTRRKINMRDDPRKQLAEEEQQHSHADALEHARTVWKQGRGRETGMYIKRKSRQETW